MHIGAALTCCTIWGAAVVAALDQGWGHSALADAGDAVGFEQAARAIAEEKNAGNLSFILIEGRKRTSEYHLSNGEAVDSQTVFQVASLSKWLTAWGVMSLIEEGEIDLDAPVSDYISRWQIPASEFNPSGITVRRLLSHTAGLTDGLGYDGFDRAHDRQALEASLSRAADASPGKDGRIVLGSKPGSGFAYSGGGYTLLQLLVEEVSGKPFSEYMNQRVFTPLGMKRTTFDHAKALELGLAENFATNGTREPFRWYTTLGATSLFTTTEDLSRFIISQAPDASNPVLSTATMYLLRQPHASEMGADIWGLGTMIYASNNAGGHIIGHDGSNEPAINTAARLDPATGDGIVILSTGNPMLATELAGEWVFWKTGNVDSLTFALRLPTAMAVFAAGVLMILLAAAVAIRRGRRKPAAMSNPY